MPLATRLEDREGLGLSGSPIGSVEQIPKRPSPTKGDPDPATVLCPVMQEMAALAERSQIARLVVSRIMIEMRRRQDDLGSPQLIAIGRKVDKGDRPPLPVPPAFGVGIKPTAITQVRNHPPMRPATTLASSVCSLEPDDTAELASRSDNSP